MQSSSAGDGAQRRKNRVTHPAAGQDGPATPTRRLIAGRTSDTSQLAASHADPTTPPLLPSDGDGLFEGHPARRNSLSLDSARKCLRGHVESGHTRAVGAVEDEFLQFDLAG
jgi:hypothetical protein